MMRIGSKNTQELMYMERIASKDLMSPDLKLTDLNKNINFTKRFDRTSFKSKSSRRPELPVEQKMDSHYSKKRNSKSQSNFDQDLKLPKVDHQKML